MLQPDDFYTVSDIKHDDHSVTCSINYNSSHRIFDGHFPGNPIVPGVCTLQMIMELLQRVLQKQLRLISAGNVKFLQLITPDLVPHATINWAIAGNIITVNALLKSGGVTIFKLNAAYSDEG